MMSQFLAPAALLAAALTAPVAAADKPDLPPLTVQTLPVGKLLADIKATIRLVAGPAAEETVKKFDKGLEEKLGEKGFEGLDLSRPLTGYMHLPEKLDLEKLQKDGKPDPELLDEFYGFVVVPVTGEKEFLDLLARLDVAAEPVKKVKGLYNVVPKGKDADEDPPLRLRFHAGHAYIGINADDDDLDPEDLVPVADLVVPGETAQFSYRAYYQRLPAGLKQTFQDVLKKLPDQVDAAPIPDAGKEAVKPLIGLYKRFGEQLMAEGDVAAVRLKVDTATGDAGYEVALSAKPGTKLAKEFAARKPTTNAFAGLFTETTVGGFVLQMPLFAPEIRDSVAAGLAEGAKMTADQIPDPYKDVVAELWAGAARTARTGEFDLAAAVSGPDKDGHYSVAAAISYEGAAKLEAKLRKLHADAPEEIQNQIKLDAAKAGNVGIHRMPVGLFLPPQAKQVFGEKVSAAVAFGPAGVYLTFGPDSIGAMKTALAAKPGPAKPFDIQVNPARLGKLVAAAAGEQGGAAVTQVVGAEDGLMSVLFLALDGGNELTLRYGTNIKLLGGMFKGYAAQRAE